MSYSLHMLNALATLLVVPPSSEAFLIPRTRTLHNRCSHPSIHKSFHTSILSSSSDNVITQEGQARLSQEEEDALQWDLFLQHQAKGKWRGTWMSYDYMGDVIDTTTASVNLIHDAEKDTVEHTHDIVVGSTSSDCETCFDSTEVRTIPVGTYTKGNLAKYRCASVAMACGPSLLRSGAMSTELVLTHGDGRVRLIYQHAPVWEAGVEPGSCPPQGLKLFRTVVSREVLGGTGPPTPRGEESNPPARGNPKFFRPVPPFLWHKRWAGSSWTWGEQTGDRGWAITELEEADAWHGRPTGDTSDVWAMRLPGGILLQCPRVITTGRAGIYRLAWLPEDDDGDDTARLLRVEASVVALEPIIDEEQDVMLGFYPPTLGSLRCDVFQKIGELENVSMLEKLRSMGEMNEKDDGNRGPLEESSTEKSLENDTVEKKDENDEPSLDDNELDDIRNALKL